MIDLPGAIFCFDQIRGPDTLIFYDQPDFDVFWQMVTDLDVPIYFHPRSNVDPILSLLYDHAPWLIGPAQEYSATLSSHILGLCTNGVFESVPYETTGVFADDLIADSLNSKL